jgi:hypothetical protein
MDNGPAPAGWEEVAVGSLSLLFPPNLSNHWKTVQTPVSGIVFRNLDYDVFVSLPMEAKWSISQLREAMQDVGPDQEIDPVRMKIMAYRACPSDFHWSMEKDELTKLDALLLYRKIACSTGVRLLEEVHLKDLTCLLSVYKNRASLEWFSEKYCASGMMLFAGSEIDLNWVRPVCRSLRFSGTVYAPDLPAEAIQGLLEPRKKK